jgi:hypothetical protein
LTEENYRSQIFLSSSPSFYSTAHSLLYATCFFCRSVKFPWDISSSSTDIVAINTPAAVVAISTAVFATMMKLIKTMLKKKSYNKLS